MPLGNSSNNRADTIFVQMNAKNGTFTTPTDKVDGEGKRIKNSHTELSNVFVRGIVLMDNPSFEDKSIINKVIGIKLRDGIDGQEYMIRANPSAMTSKLLGLINNADLTKPISINVGAFAAGTKRTNLDGSPPTIRQAIEPFLTASQDGQKLKARHFDDPEKPIPKVVEIQMPIPGTKTVKTIKDSTARDEWMLQYATELDTKVKTFVGQQQAPAAKLAAAPVVADDTDHLGDTDVVSAASVLGNDPADDAAAFLESPSA